MVRCNAPGLSPGVTQAWSPPDWRRRPPGSRTRSSATKRWVVCHRYRRRMPGVRSGPQEPPVLPRAGLEWAFRLWQVCAACRERKSTGGRARARLATSPPGPWQRYMLNNSFYPVLGSSAAADLLSRPAPLNRAARACRGTQAMPALRHMTGWANPMVGLFLHRLPRSPRPSPARIPTLTRRPF
jgi:hypothetical protein